MRKLFAALLAVVLISVGIRAGEEEKPVVPAKDTAELEKRLEKIIRANNTQGLCAVIASREGISWVSGIGTADVAAGTQVTPDTLFRIGSITKMFAGLSALKLAEEGRLDLDAPVRGLVPEVAFKNRWENESPVRVVHLLEHTTGWDDLHFREYASNEAEPLTLLQGLAICPASRTSRWRPGTAFSYCNAGPAVTAAIVEKVTGQKYEDFVHENFLEPIGMPTADFFLSPASEKLITKLYHEDGKTPYPYWHIAMRPSGVLNVSAREMGAFLRFLLGRGEIDGKRLLARESIERMETPASAWGAQAGLKTGYGLHNFTKSDDEGFVWYGHDGAVEGGLALLRYLPESDIGYFFSINSDSGGAYEKIAKEIRAFATRDISPPAPPAIKPLALETVSGYDGWYVKCNSRMKFIEFIERAGSLSRVSFSSKGMRASYLGNSLEFLHTDGLKFRREKQGAESAALLETRDNGKVIALGSGDSLMKVSVFYAWTVMICSSLFLLAFISVPLFALVWIPRLLFGRLRGAPNMRVRVLPLCAFLSLLAFILVFGYAIAGDTVTLLSKPTLWAMGLTLSTWSFALFTLLSLVSAVTVDRRGMNKAAYFHSLFVSVMFAVAAFYLGWHGVIGYMSWK